MKDINSRLSHYICVCPTPNMKNNSDIFNTGMWFASAKFQVQKYEFCLFLWKSHTLSIREFALITLRLQTFDILPRLAEHSRAFSHLRI